MKTKFDVGEQQMNIGIVGLGLIGGSLARAIKKYTSHTVYGTDTDPTVLRAATNARAIDCEADISMCDIVFVCLYPRDCVSYMLHTNFKTNAIVADCAGIKQFIANKVSAPLYARGIRYVGTHPMAGKETGGFSSSDAELFQNASFIITENERTDTHAVEVISALAQEIGCTRITKCSAQKHDEVIAYTSQLAHIVSNAYVKSEASQSFSGFSAGSFMDLTRVAQLCPQMWAELFLENGDALLKEIDELQKNI
ncbi:MAG: prephenate dehydrogenase/arogenate dehydrogenase family protein, partial [Christensenella sp.]